MSNEIERLTGKLLHDAFMCHQGLTYPAWEYLSESGRESYDAVARIAREKLNLCDGCGLQKPPLLMIAYSNLCVDCVNPAKEVQGDASDE